MTVADYEPHIVGIFYVELPLQNDYEFVMKGKGRKERGELRLPALRRGHREDHHDS